VSGNGLLVAGVDIGNSTTEAALARVEPDGGKRFLASSITPTTGLKGTPENVAGIMTALEMVLERAQMPKAKIDRILLNEAAPILGGTAMETVTETVVTDSAMIGHDPRTPAGMGVATGVLVRIDRLDSDAAAEYGGVIAVADADFGYERAARLINESRANVTGLILEKDEAVLVYNRLDRKICIIDEVRRIGAVPLGVLAAIEVAPPAMTLRALCDPYGIAALLGLGPDETRRVSAVAKSFVGKRSGAVIKSPGRNVAENTLPAGKMTVYGDRSLETDVDSGAAAIMAALESAGEIHDVTGESGTNIGRMIDAVKSGMAAVSGETPRITDILAVDTVTPAAVSGGLAGETRLERALGAACMVRSSGLPMERIAEELGRKTGARARVGGAEAAAAVLGALTTPGVFLPLAVLDLGAGSTDAAVLERDGRIRYAHLAGAGDMVTMLIQTELGLRERSLAELIKRHPVAKVESLSHIRAENGGVYFYREPLAPKFYGATVILKDGELIALGGDISPEKIVSVRREAKRKVFVTNALRAVKKVSPDAKLPYIALAGGSAEDFEIPPMLMEAFAEMGTTCGRGNVRGVCGPRNAVATGLVLAMED